MAKYPKRTPLEAIRRFCMECQGDLSNAKYVTDCRDMKCPFYAYRHGTPPDGQPHRPMSAIKAYCHGYCLPDGREEVANCQGDMAYAGPCPVFPFRLGVNPNRQPLSDERRLSLLEAGKKTRFLPGVKAPCKTPESTNPTQPIL